ncbi:MAG: hypothetical protein R2932_50400 [Caldilineaceae bacterium]
MIEKNWLQRQSRSARWLKKIGANAVFGAATNEEGVTVIPVAQVAYGFGYGGGYGK